MPEYEVFAYEGDNYIARIHKPILWAEERKVREENIKAALMKFEIERRSKFDNQN